MPIILGIDGTDGWMRYSAARNADYDQRFRDSFVTRIARYRNNPNIRYYRGPVGLGQGTGDTAQAALAWVRSRKAQAPREPVLLTGYSRGAASVVQVAKWLNDGTRCINVFGPDGYRNVETKIHVDVMMLFDTVDRTDEIDAYVCPRDVGRVHHVMRDPRSQSRNSFRSLTRGDAGTRWALPAGRYTQKKYMCTHGGMGGMWWRKEETEAEDHKCYPDSHLIDEGRLEVVEHTNISFAQDRAVSAQIWRDIRPFLGQHGFLPPGAFP